MAEWDLYKLRIFASVAEAGSFTAAAERLYLTQPAVSQHMQELEAGLGATLFLRGRRGVTLTAEGRVLAGYAERIFKLIGDAEHELVNVARLASGHISIGATPGVGAYLLPMWTQRFTTHYPGITVQIKTGTTAEITALLQARAIELAFVEGEPSRREALRLDHRVVCDVPQLLVAGRRHALWGRATLALRELAPYGFVARQRGSETRAWMEQVLREHGVTPRVIAELDSPEAIKRMAASGAGLAFLPLYAMPAEADKRDLHVIGVDAPLSRRLRAIWRSPGPLSPAARAFMAHVEQCVDDAPHHGA